MLYPRKGNINYLTSKYLLLQLCVWCKMTLYCMFRIPTFRIIFTFKMESNQFIVSFYFQTISFWFRIILCMLLVMEVYNVWCLNLLWYQSCITSGYAIFVHWNVSGINHEKYQKNFLIRFYVHVNWSYAYLFSCHEVFGSKKYMIQSK